MFNRRKLIFVPFVVAGWSLYCYQKDYKSQIYEKYPEIANFDITKKRVTNFSSESTLPRRMQSVPMDLEWSEDSKVEIIQTDSEKSNSDVNVYVGGLEALFACSRKLGDSNEKCVYINDGKVPIAIRAGQQLHEHPTQYPDYTLAHLIKKLFEKVYLAPKENPETYDYSPLHYSLRGLLTEPITFVKCYMGMFIHTLWHKYKFSNRVSDNDQNLVNMIRQSIEYMRVINEDIVKVTNKSIMTQNGRLYWSIDKDLIDKKAQHWRDMGISCSLIEPNETQTVSLLNTEKHKIYALKMHKDGEIHPDIFETMVEYLSKKYPDQFEYKIAQMTHLKLSKEQQPNSIALETNGTKQEMNTKTLFSSLGHNSVYQKGNQVYNVIPVSGITSDWKMKISKKEFSKRLPIGVKLEEYLEKCNVVPCADMFNLHVKILDHSFENDDINFYVRVTEGANVYNNLAEKRDLVNIAYKLNTFFIGDWKILTAGTCTRKTGVINRPENWKFFNFGQSGVGISCSAGVWNDHFKK